MRHRARPFKATSNNTDPQPGMPARYATSCPRCPDPINRGDRIVYLRGVAIHVRCASGADDE